MLIIPYCIRLNGYLVNNIPLASSKYKIIKQFCNHEKLSGTFNLDRVLPQPVKAYLNAGQTGEAQLAPVPLAACQPRNTGVTLHTASSNLNFHTLAYPEIMFWEEAKLC